MIAAKITAGIFLALWFGLLLTTSPINGSASNRIAGLAFRWAFFNLGVYLLVSSALELQP